MNIRNHLLLATGLGLAVASAAPVADARGLTGYGAFTPIPNKSSQTCMTEFWGGAQNTCAGTVSKIVFELPIDTSGVNKNITARSFGTGNGAISCQAIGQHALATNAYFGAQQTFNPTGIESKVFSGFVPSTGELRLQCTNIVQNRGILNLHWDI